MKADITMANSDFNVTIARFLEKIPCDLDLPQSIDEIIATTFETTANKERLRNIADAVVSFLDCFGVISWHEQTIRAKSQIPTYFLQSLAWYFRNSETIFANWDRTGTARDIELTNLLDASPYFLKVLEKRRVSLAKMNNHDLGFSRSQSASVILIKTIQRNQQYFLHQWDTKAEQYQLIGGKLRNDETPTEAAKRELFEEISEHDLVYQRDYDLTLLTETPIHTTDVSRTYGALTAYEFWLFSATLKFHKLKLAEIDKWLSLDEMRNGLTKTGKRMTDSALCRQFEAVIPSGFSGLEQSIELKRKDFLSCIEIKPGFWGINLDIKKLFGRNS